MSTQWSSGDVVQLKSGSPAMTVHSSDDKQTSCVWFDDSGVKFHTFAPSVLKKYEAEKTVTPPGVIAG